MHPSYYKDTLVNLYSNTLVPLDVENLIYKNSVIPSAVKERGFVRPTLQKCIPFLGESTNENKKILCQFGFEGHNMRTCARRKNIFQLQHARDQNDIIENEALQIDTMELNESAILLQVNLIILLRTKIHNLSNNIYKI